MRCGVYDMNEIQSKWAMLCWSTLMLRESNNEECRGKLPREVMLQQYSTLVHTRQIAMHAVYDRRFQPLPHTPYFPIGLQKILIFYQNWKLGCGTRDVSELTWLQRSSAWSVVHEPGGLLVPLWVASSPIHFLKAQNLYFMKKFGGHVNRVA